jgi:hypothetical protein
VCRTLRRIQVANRALDKKTVQFFTREIHYELLPPEMRAIIVAVWERRNTLNAA